MKIKAFILLSVLLISCGNKSPRDKIDQSQFEGETTLKVAVVKLEDNGVSGEKIGCGDSIIYIDKTAEGIKLEDSRKVQLALKELFAIGETAVDGPYYNGLQYATGLKVESVNESENPDKTTIEVNISGEMASGGTCDDPRITEQIMSTIKANSTADEIKVYINDKDLDGYFNMK